MHIDPTIQCSKNNIVRNPKIFSIIHAMRSSPFSFDDQFFPIKKN
jgi:hypothetical protein